MEKKKSRVRDVTVDYGKRKKNKLFNSTNSYVEFAPNNAYIQKKI